MERRTLLRALADTARALGGTAEVVVLPGRRHLIEGAAAVRALDLETRFLARVLA